MGKRLLPLTGGVIPKPMASICGKPILQWQLESLRDEGVTEFCIVTGHLGRIIQDHFGDGSEWSVSIRYFHEETPMGTAGALAHIGDFFKEDFFLLVFGDTIFDIYVSRMERVHKEKRALASMFVHPNSHPSDSDLAILDKESRVVSIDSKHNVRNNWYDNMVNAGFYILSAKSLEYIKKTGKTDLEKDFLLPLIEKRAPIFGYVSTEYIKDAGTADRIEQIEGDIAAGTVAAKKLSKPQKCIFLDRDGTLNKYKGLVYKTEDMELEETAIEAVKLINGSPYLAIVVTNQPAIARGLCEITQIEKIHRKMSTLLGRGGAYLDDMIFCPHHPDKGYPEENTAFKISCECRKPRIGMLKKSAARWNINLSDSWIIGDTTRDIQTGKNAGLRSILVKTGEGGKDDSFAATPDHVCENILEAVSFILKGEVS